MESSRRSPPCSLVIFGASGDLTRRKLLPALRRLASEGRLPLEFVLIGVGRTDMSDAEFRRLGRNEGGPGTSERWERLLSQARYVAGGYEDPTTYQTLAELLKEGDDISGTSGNRLFYLATPPQLFGVVPRLLGAAGLSGARPEDSPGW